MKKYKCYITSDTNQEAVSVVEAVDSTAALNYFALEKKLEVEQFVRIFSISEWEQKNTSKTS